MDALLIPCFNRPELLHETLKNLVATGDMDTVHVVFKPDSGYSPSILTVIDLFRTHLPSFEVVRPTPAKYTMTKQSRNVLTGYIHAASVSSGLVFMVEEDVMVSRDFFKFNRELFRLHPNTFASLSRTNLNRSAAVTDRTDAYYLSDGDYCSIGVTMHRDTIFNYIQPHANERYYRDCIAYCRSNFPKAHFPEGHAEQDGLIRRIQMASGKPTAYPHVPRCFHAGWYGYNRRRSPMTGTLDQKIQRVQDTIYDKDKAIAAAINPSWAADSLPENLNPEPWTTLQHIPPTPRP